MKRLSWDSPPRRDRSVPKHPYRDSALVYAGLAALVVVLALVTGGSILRAIVAASFVFVAATLWSWRIWRNRLRGADAEAEERTL
jgi:Flp pilus assembly protein TadB